MERKKTWQMGDRRMGGKRRNLMKGYEGRKVWKRKGWRRRK